MLKNLLLLLAVLMACAAGSEDDVHAEVKSAYNTNDGNGHFKYGLDITNGVKAKAEGDVNVIHAEYYLLGEHSERLKVTYTADSTGFHPVVGA